MGHSRMGTLPATRKWQQVITMIGAGANVEDVAAATANAAEAGLAHASNDPAVRQTVYLLTQVPLAARADDFAAALKRLGLRVSEAPSLVEIGAALMDAVDRRVRQAGGRTDFGEMAQLSAVESLHAVAGREIADLFGQRHAAEDARTALAGLATVKQFGLLARDFFARLTRRFLDYFLSRELPSHVGVNARFHSLREHHAFKRALDAHARETALIVRDFAGEWFSKTDYEGGITPDKAGRFAHVAFRKIRSELRTRHAVHA